MEPMDSSENPAAAEKKFTSFDVRLIDENERDKKDPRLCNLPTPPNYTTPGEVVKTDPGYMRGHGTFSTPDQTLVASLVGSVEQVNRLITVKGIGGIYYGDVGDVVVGRITKRRRSAEDELAMREILKEGDVISAEVQSVYSDGSLALHTRSVKYGKLGPGVLMKVPSSLIKRRKNHILNLFHGVCVILGNNGYIWISPLENGRMPGTNLEEEDPTGGKPLLEEIKITNEDRSTVARLKNCISAIAKLYLPIFDTSIQYAYEASEKYEVKELLNPDVMKEVGELVRVHLIVNEGL